MAGKMITLLGVEYLQSPLDVNFSRSTLFGYATPFTHVGVRTSYAANDALTLYAGINNGWDHLPGHGPIGTLELGLVAAALRKVSLAVTGYLGTERAAVGPRSRGLVAAAGVADADAQLQLGSAATCLCRC